MGRYTVSVPRNNLGIEDYNNMVEDSSNIDLFVIPNDEFQDFYLNICDDVNELCGTLIDEFESDSLSYKEVEKVLPILDKLKPYQTIYKAFDLALNRKTELYFDL